MTAGDPQGADPETAETAEPAENVPLSAELIRARALLLACIIVNAGTGVIWAASPLVWWLGDSMGRRWRWRLVRELLDPGDLGWPMVAAGLGGAGLIAAAALGRRVLRGEAHEPRAAFITGLGGGLIGVGAVIYPFGRHMVSFGGDVHLAQFIYVLIIISAPLMCAVLNAYAFFTQRRLFGVMADEHSDLARRGVPLHLRRALHTMGLVAVAQIGLGSVIALANVVALLKERDNLPVGPALIGFGAAAVAGVFVAAGFGLARSLSRDLARAPAAARHAMIVASLLAATVVAQCLGRAAQLGTEFGAGDLTWAVLFSVGPVFLGPGVVMSYGHLFDEITAFGVSEAERSDA